MPDDGLRTERLRRRPHPHYIGQNGRLLRDGVRVPLDYAPPDTHPLRLRYALRQSDAVDRTVVEVLQRGRLGVVPG